MTLGWLVVGWMALLSPLLLAHRPTESSADVRWLHGRIEVELRLSLPLATALLGDPAVPVLRAGDVTPHAAALARRIDDGFAVRAPAGRLIPASIIVTLDDGDVLARILYPPLAPAALSVDAPFLLRLPPDAFCFANIWASPEDLLASRRLSRAATTLSAPSPALRP